MNASQVSQKSCNSMKPSQGRPKGDFHLQLVKLPQLAHRGSDYNNLHLLF